MLKTWSIHLVVSIETSELWQTDGQTQGNSCYCASIASHGPTVINETWHWLDELFVFTLLQVTHTEDSCFQWWYSHTLSIHSLLDCIVTGRVMCMSHRGPCTGEFRCACSLKLKLLEWSCVVYDLYFSSFRKFTMHMSLILLGSLFWVAIKQSLAAQ